MELSAPSSLAAGATLVLPAVAVGHAAQLAVDRLIAASTAAAAAAGLVRAAGTLDDADVLPIAGNDAGRFVAPLEVYQSSDKTVTVVQQRAPLRENAKNAFCSRLVALAQASGVAHVILLTTADAGQLHDAQLSGPRLCYVHTTTVTADVRARFTALDGAAPLDAVVPAEPANPGVRADATPVLPLAGSGIARVLLRHAEKAGLPTSVLVLYTGRAESIAASSVLADALVCVLGLPETAPAATWPIPAAWVPLLAGPVETMLYM